MTISTMIRQGFHYARRCKSLWLFGFLVGLASGGSSGGGNSAGGTAAGAAHVGFELVPSAPLIVVAALVVFLLAFLAFLAHSIAEGALIEGIARERRGDHVTTREGLRAGLAHWGVVMRIALLYFAATVISLAVLIAPCVIAAFTLGKAAAITLGIPAAIVAVPWLVTLYLIQAFALRIAVLENRQALDAIQKARLFLHGRLMHGLKLAAATFVGSLAIGLFTIVVLVPTVLMFVALASVLPLVSVVLLCSALLLPACYVLLAVLGIFRSSVWTIGYLSQAEA